MKLFRLGFALLTIGIFFGAGFSSSAFGASKAYDLKMKLSLNGKHVSSPQLIITEGEIGSIIQKDGDSKTFIEVVATNGELNKKKGILLDLKIGTVDKEGARHLISTPKLLVKENEPGIISIVNEANNSTDLDLNVTVTRTTL